MGHILKQVLLIGSGNNSVQTELGNNYKYDFDIDELAGTMSFTLPYIKFNSDADLTKFKKYDTVKLYAGLFDVDPGEIIVDGIQVYISGLKLEFDGYIDTISLSKNKDDFPYEFNCISTAGLLNERNLIRKTTTTEPIKTKVNTILQLSGLQSGQIAIESEITAINIFPDTKIRKLCTDIDNLLVSSVGGKQAGEELKSICKKIAVKVFQSGDGYLNILTLSFMNTRPNSLGFYSWEFRYGDNIYSINYNDLTKSINSVVCLGIPPMVGYAVDPIAVQLTAGVGVTPGPQHYNYLTIECRDENNIETLQKIARNKLLDIMKNYNVEISVPFNVEYMCGQPITIYDNDKYPNGQIFFIKHISKTISKENVECILTCFANSISVLPENLVIDSTGITDIDMLGTDVINDMNDATGWNYIT